VCAITKPSLVEAKILQIERLAHGDVVGNELLAAGPYYEMQFFNSALEYTLGNSQRLSKTCICLTNGCRGYLAPRGFLLQPHMTGPLSPP
jgi:hypothetical protein